MVFFLYFGFSVAALILFMIWRRETRVSFIFSPFLLFAFNEIVRVWPAVFYARATGVSTDSYAGFVVLSGVLSFCLGFIIFRTILGWKNGSPLEFRNRPMEPISPRENITAILLTGALLASLGLYLFQGPPPIWEVFTKFLKGASTTDIAKFMSSARETVTKGHYFGGEYRGQGLIRMLMQIGWPLLMGMSLMFFFQRRGFRRLVLFIITLIFSLLFVAGDGSRGPFMWGLVFLIILTSLAFRIKARKLILFTMACLVFIFLLSMPYKFAGVMMGDRPLLGGGQRILKRITIDNGIDSIHVIEFMRTGEMERRNGDIHKTDFLNALPGIQVKAPFAYELYTALYPDDNRTTYASMTYLAILYGDFGWLGVLAGYFLLGSLIAVMTCVLFNQPKKAHRVVIIAFLSMFLGQVNLGGPIGLATKSFVILSLGSVYYVFLIMGKLLRLPSILNRRSNRPVWRHQEAGGFNK